MSHDASRPTVRLPCTGYSRYRSDGLIEMRYAAPVGAAVEPSIIVSLGRARVASGPADGRVLSSMQFCPLPPRLVSSGPSDRRRRDRHGSASLDETSKPRLCLLSKEQGPPTDADGPFNPCWNGYGAGAASAGAVAGFVKNGLLSGSGLMTAMSFCCSAMRRGTGGGSMASNSALW